MALTEELAALTPVVMERYWAKVDKNGPLWQGTPCWVWTSACTKRGYGQLGVKMGVRHVKMYAHRIALLIAGRMADGMESCHKCNNPPCVNPDHLYPGTHEQNMMQAWTEGLIPKPCPPIGELQWNARLTDSQVAQLRMQRAAGAKLIDLAAVWDCDFTTVSDICRGKTRRAAGGPLTRCFTHRRTVVAS